MGDTLIHDSFAGAGVVLPAAVAGGNAAVKGKGKKQRAPPPEFKAQRVTHLPTPTGCVDVEAAAPLLLSTLASLLQQVGWSLAQPQGLKADPRQKQDCILRWTRSVALHRRCWKPKPPSRLSGIEPDMWRFQAATPPPGEGT